MYVHKVICTPNAIIMIDNREVIGKYAISSLKKVQGKTDQFWRNYKPKKRPRTCSRKLNNFGEKNENTKLHFLANQVC